jgi:hypothetical protein
MFAARQAGAEASLEQMKAICYCIRNRARAGWHDGGIFLAVELAQEHSAHEEKPVIIDPNARPFQRLTRDIDEVFFGDRHGSPFGVDDASPDLSDTLAKQKFWCFLDRPIRPWFKTNIIDDHKNHANTAQMGLMLFYE